MCVAFHVEVKGTEIFVKAVLWSCESCIMNIKCRLLMKKHVKLVFLPSCFLYFLSFFFPVLKFTLKTLGQADLYCLALDWAPLEAVLFCCAVFPSRSCIVPIGTTTKQLSISPIHFALPYICYKCLLKSAMKILTYSVAPDEVMMIFWLI